MKVKELLGLLRVKNVQGAEDAAFSGICFDSRQVGQGSLFVAVRGTQADGHAYIRKAAEQGASVIVGEAFEQEYPGVTTITVEDSAAALGTIASAFYGRPSSQLRLVGVTGTNGKTTVATLLFQLFTELGYKCGLISTVQNHIHTRVVPATHTTPDPVALNGLLREMADSGCDYCFMEVSSHAVAQHRIEGLEFAGGIFTNLTHDHLDFHQTFKAYLEAKKGFFDGLGRTAFALTNADDRNGMVMLQNTAAHQKTYALKTMADFKGRVIENRFSGLLLNINDQEVWFRMVGSFNAYNLLAVYGAAMLLEQDSTRVLTVLSRLRGAEGRFDYLTSPEGVTAIVDYAHTPDAVQNVLNTVNDIRKGSESVITVLGCGGDRDKTKRPVMAQVAVQNSDKVILTSDNPRSEDPAQIIRDMEAGLDDKQRSRTMSVTDRKEAIKIAFNLAKSGDIIVVAGKGHEKYQEVKGVKLPFDDKQVLSELLNPLN